MSSGPIVYVRRSSGPIVRILRGQGVNVLARRSDRVVKLDRSGPRGATGGTGSSGADGADGADGVMVDPWSPEAFGATGDGITDDTASLAACIAAAGTGGAMVLTPGGVYSHTGLTIPHDDFTIVGNGAHLLCTSGTATALDVTGDGFTLDTARVSGPGITRDSTSYGVAVRDCDGASITGCEVFGTEAAGIFLTGASNAAVTGNYVHHTLADGIHITNQSRNCTVNGNRVGSNTSDDCIAVVGYQSNGGPCQDITITGNTVTDSAARGVTAFGAERVTIIGNNITGTDSAAVIVGYDGSYNTLGCSGIVVQGNTITDANRTVNNAALYVNGNSTYTAEGVDIIGNIMIDCNYRGIATFGGGTADMKGVVIESNVIIGSLSTAIYLAVGASLSVKSNTFIRCIDAVAAVPSTQGVMALDVSSNTCIDMNPTNASFKRFFTGESNTFLSLKIADNKVDGGNAQAMYRCPSATNVVIRGNTRNGVIQDNFAGQPATRGTESIWSGLDIDGDLIIASPNGTKYTVEVSDGGTLSAVAV